MRYTQPMPEQRPKKQLPQNLKDLLKDIGESAILFQIFTKIHTTKWQAFKNLQHSGCDLVLINAETNQTIKIEVKTRQSLYTTATSTKTKRIRQFEVTKNEYDQMDILICYWFDYNSYFIVPKSELNPDKNTIRLRINRQSNGSYGNNDKFLNNWTPLFELME